MHYSRIGIIGNSERLGSKETLAALVRALSEAGKGIECRLTESMAQMLGEGHGCTVCESSYDVVRSSQAVFSLGGDGTMLASARAIMRVNPACDLIGINLGKLGFIAENPPEDIPILLPMLLDGNLHREPRTTILATLSTETPEIEGVTIQHDDLDPSRVGNSMERASMVALNEIVIDNYGSTRMLTFEVSVSGKLLGTMRADGLIVATPTGSTGYGVSAGGPIIEPTCNVLLIAPIAPHSLSVRPVLVPDGAEVVVRALTDESRQVLVVADGQEEAVVKVPAEIRVTARSEKLSLLRNPANSYFDLLRNKLFWSVDPRDGREFRR